MFALSVAVREMIMSFGCVLGIGLLATAFAVIIPMKPEVETSEGGD